MIFLLQRSEFNSHERCQIDVLKIGSFQFNLEKSWSEGRGKTNSLRRRLCLCFLLFTLEASLQHWANLSATPLLGQQWT